MQVVFIANPKPPRFEGQAKHEPFTTMLVVILQFVVDEEDVTQFPPCVVLTHFEGGRHPHYVVVFANPLEFANDPHNTQFPLTNIEFKGLQTHLLLRAL